MTRKTTKAKIMPDYTQQHIQRIFTDADVSSWRSSSTSYATFVSWIKRRSERIKGRRLHSKEEEGWEGIDEVGRERITSLLHMLDHLDSAILTRHPPSSDTKNRRFGDKAFRGWWEEEVKQNLVSILPSSLPPHILPQLLSLLIDSHAFGHPARLDYGSGHELSFVAALFGLTEEGWVGRKRRRLESGGRRRSEAGSGATGGQGASGDASTSKSAAVVDGEQQDDDHGGHGAGDGGDSAKRADKIEAQGTDHTWDLELEEDELILRVFPRYLLLVTHLQKTYNLEPAGSHGVWGLDDYCFLPYVFGSAQLLGTSGATPEVRRAKEAVARKKAGTSDSASSPDDLWTLSLSRVFEFKSGPFHEHSPLLHSLSTTMGPTFLKIHSGLLKMYQEEVLGKRVVVQHLCLAGDWLWEGTSRLIEKKKARDIDQQAGTGTGSHAPNPDYRQRQEGEAAENDKVQAQAQTPPPALVATKAPWAK